MSMSSDDTARFGSACAGGVCRGGIVCVMLPDRNVVCGGGGGVCVCVVVVVGIIQ